MVHHGGVLGLAKPGVGEVAAHQSLDKGRGIGADQFHLDLRRHIPHRYGIDQPPVLRKFVSIGHRHQRVVIDRETIRTRRQRASVERRLGNPGAEGQSRRYGFLPSEDISIMNLR